MKTHRTQRPRRTAAIVLIAISAFMTSFIIIWCANGVMDFLNYLGINRSALQLPYAWMLAAATAAGYILYTAQMIPEVRRNLFCFKGIFKWLGIYAALVGGIVEEAVFRQMLMDWLHDSGTGTLLQVILSALAFTTRGPCWEGISAQEPPQPHRPSSWVHCSHPSILQRGATSCRPLRRTRSSTSSSNPG